MRYDIQIKSTKGAWITDQDTFKFIDSSSDDESKIMKSFVDFCSSKPSVVGRHGIRIFDNNIYDWVLRTEVPEGFKPFVDPICVLWNFSLSKDHDLLEFKV